MKKDQSKELGVYGEKLAMDFLERKGYEILEKNWRTFRYEVDIICRKKELIIFVEVKTRKSTLFGYPEGSIGNKKISNLVRAAGQYLDEKSLDNEVRFDIIAIIISNGNVEIEHFEDTYYPL